MNGSNPPSIDPPAIDWTGVEPDRSPIGPLDPESFVTRLRMLNERANSLLILREAFAQQKPYAGQLPRDSKPPSRQSR